MITRYQTKEMTKIWDDESRFARWVQIEIAACEAFHARGEVSDDDIEAIRKGHHQNAERIREHEKETNHDVVAFVRSMSETVGEPACRHIHRGMTSSDVVDTALAMSLKESFEVVIPAAEALRDALAKQAIAKKTRHVLAEPTEFTQSRLRSACAWLDGTARCLGISNGLSQPPPMCRTRSSLAQLVTTVKQTLSLKRSL